MAPVDQGSAPKDDGAIIQSIGIAGYHIVNDETRPRHTLFTIELRTAVGR